MHRGIGNRLCVHSHIQPKPQPSSPAPPKRQHILRLFEHHFLSRLVFAHQLSVSTFQPRHLCVGHVRVRACVFFVCVLVAAVSGWIVLCARRSLMHAVPRGLRVCVPRHSARAVPRRSRQRRGGGDMPALWSGLLLPDTRRRPVSLPG